MGGYKGKHVFHCMFLFLLIFLFISGTNKGQESSINIFGTYGLLGTIILYILRLSPLFSIIPTIFNFCGLVFYNTFPKNVELKSSLTRAPFLCIRVVTRGLFPNLILRNIPRNLEICKNVGLENFILEVVTDYPIFIPKNEKVREIIIPGDYKTKNGSLFKARALHYCWEDNVNRLSDSDWIVHIDEETLLTEASLKGILNFVTEDKYDFGQGTIIYASEVVNWITTLADAYRVAQDMGMFRFQFYAFNKAILGWKGSFMVAKAISEKKVSFDHGPEGSISDGHFALKASSMGYTFNFIEGEMCEMSPFTVFDFIRQRKRWFQGMIITGNCETIPLKYRLLFLLHTYAWLALPLRACNYFTAEYYPVPFLYVLDLLIAFIGAVGIYLHIYGSIRSYSMKQYGYFKIVLVLATIIVLPLVLILEIVAIFLAIITEKKGFYVIDKNIWKT
ncbi:beta-1,4-mannosyltransferase egh isoform X1 [Pieris rapae]|uniref:beta-1,4-mannosyltransferase egh isoform X1 n=1 Tax=Pieris rapae TaxID=64459 RepID=UPI001E27FBFB|nr:beta-1,4-mannosyltransferase egh isoform X1 [Pieris rapae]